MIRRLVRILTPAVLIGCSVAAQPGSSGPVGFAPTPVASLQSAVVTGCGPSDVKPDEGPAQSGSAFGVGLPKVIMSSGTPVTEAQALAAFPDLLEPRAVPEDLSLQLILLPPTGSAASYVQLIYSAKPVGEGETDLEFYSVRGLIITQGPAHGRTAAVVKETVGDAAQIVQVGPHDAALVHDSPWADGIRPYHLYWSDGTQDFRAGATTTPAELVDVARSIYCSQ